MCSNNLLSAASYTFLQHDVKQYEEKQALKSLCRKLMADVMDRNMSVYECTTQLHSNRQHSIAPL